MLHKYSVKTLVTEWNKNKPIIDAYLKNHSIEGADGSSTGSEVGEKAAKILGWGIGIFIIVAIVVVGIWFWALFITIKSWPRLPTWAKVVSVIGLFFGWSYGIGSVITLIVVYASRRKQGLGFFDFCGDSM